MATIIRTTPIQNTHPIYANPGSTPPLSPQASINDLCITDLHNDDPWKRTVGELLILLGQKVLKKVDNHEFLTVAQIAKYCRNYRLRWRGSTRARDLELAIRDYLKKSAAIMGCGVKVDYRTEWNQSRRREQLFLKFERFYPDTAAS